MRRRLNQHETVRVAGLEFDSDLLTFLIDLFKRRDNVEKLDIRGDSRIRSLTTQITITIISGREIKLRALSLTNELLVLLLSLVRPHYDVKEMNISGTQIGLTACEAVSTVLQDPSCNLVWLYLETPPIDDECANVFAGALRNNEKLEQLRFGQYHNLGRNVYNAFADALCDPTGINTIISSNHTLKVLGGDMIPNVKIQRHLAFNNGSNDKKEVAIHKVLRYYRRFDMSSFFEWELKFLPIAVNWMDSAGANLDLHKFDVIYQFLQAMAEFLASAAGQ